MFAGPLSTRCAFNMFSAVSPLLWFLVLPVACDGALIELTIKFSNSSVNYQFFNGSEDRMFGLNWYTCMDQIGTPSCPGGQATFNEEYWVTMDEEKEPNTWFKSIDTGSIYTGPVVIDIFAPLPMTVTEYGTLSFTSSVTACADDLEDYEMGGEICGHHGKAWVVNITDIDGIFPITAFPAFGLGETGKSFIMLTQFYSSQLNNSRDIPVYIPPSLLQNYVKRKVNVMIVLDGSLSVIESYSTRTGFEASQLMGVIPESIMIGISTVEFAYQINFDQRTYELTYDEALSYPDATCITGPMTGGTPLLLDWIDKDVIPSVLASLGGGGDGMLRGEVSITGGSLGGLTSCYAAAARPEVFARAVCCSPSNCFNYGNGGLAAFIAANHSISRILPKTIIQYIGAETYDEDLSVQAGDEDQLGYFINEDKAWQSIGMKPMPLNTLYTAANIPDHIPYPYTVLAPLPEHVVMSLRLPGGQHAPSTWQQEFSAALPNLYRADPPDKDRIAISESLQYFSSGLHSSSDESEDGENETIDKDAVIIALAVTTGILFVAVILLLLQLFLFNCRSKSSTPMLKSGRSNYL